LVNAPRFRVTHVVGAHIVIIAVQEALSGTRAIDAKVNGRAGVGIVTVGLVGLKLAPLPRAAGVVGTRVGIVTDEGRGPGTESLLAEVDG
jgi:hypothetical protein